MEYYTIELTKEEIDEISIALRIRIEDLSQKLNQVQTVRGKNAIMKMLQNCITAQKQTSYSGQPLEYLYIDESYDY